jgi:autophagy-related protein 11
LAAAVPPADQILLLGPPYKVPKDSTLQSDEILNSLRLGDAEDDPIPEEEATTSTAATTGGATADATTTTTTTTATTDPTIMAVTAAATSSSSSPCRKILATTERSGARRLFLFSKQALSENAPDPPPCRLEPMELKLPTMEDVHSEPSPVLNIDSHSSSNNPMHAGMSHHHHHQRPPLHQALAAYERQFMLYLSQGRLLADGSDLRLAACRTCVQEQAIMAKALRAAVSNLSDIALTATRTRADFTDAFTSKTVAHAALLQRFDSTILPGLAAIPLHPALVSLARASGRVFETLLDTVPVEKERQWANQCQGSHLRLLALFGELDTAFSQLGTRASREEEARRDRLAEDEIQALWQEVETTAKQIRSRQAQRANRLATDHCDVVRFIMDALHSCDQDDDLYAGGAAQAAFGPLGEKSKSSKDIVPAMLTDDATLKELMQRIAHAKSNAMKRMKVRLREVSRAQSSIQRVLTSVGVLRDALAQQTENMSHLETVVQLPTAYRHFLSELRRRRAYGQAVTSTAQAMMERLATMRADELKARERFLCGPGRHLMPAFYDIFAPTLATPPPLFTPQMPAMVELDTLPNVDSPAPGEEGESQLVLGDNNIATTAEEAAVTEMQGVQAAVVEQGGGVSSASSLTSASQYPSSTGAVVATSTTRAAAAAVVDQDAMSTTPATASHQQTGATVTFAVAGEEQSAVSQQQEQQQQQRDRQEQQQQQDQLIVSADEHDDLILDQAGGGGAAVDAQVKTLAYENAVLRQALEGLGGKAPRVYVEEARAKGTAAASQSAHKITADDSAEVAALRKELAEAKAKAHAATDALKASVTMSDKISHSSFTVGDVGLFMPTGRGSGGKRTYLAFHTNCPHRYLSTDCIKGTPDFVLGRIVYQEELVAGEVGTAANPYGLHVGTKFWVLTVEVLSSHV